MPPSCMSREAFETYIDAFNRDDEAAYGAYYAEDVVLVLAGERELRGRRAIVEFYRTVKAETRRTILVRNMIADPHRVAAELESEFLALRDVPDFAAGPMRAGDRIYLNTFVFYDVRDGRFRRIRSAAFRKEHRPAAPHEAGEEQGR